MKGEVLWNTLKINVLFCHDNVSDLLISYSYLKVVDAMQVVPVLEMRKECCQMELNVSLALMQYRCEPIMHFYQLVHSRYDFQLWENLIQSAVRNHEFAILDLLHCELSKGLIIVTCFVLPFKRSHNCNMFCPSFHENQ